MGRRGGEWSGTGGNRRFGGSEVVGGGETRVKRGIPRRHKAGSQVGGPCGCGGVVVMAGKGREGSRETAVRAGRGGRRRR